MTNDEINLEEKLENEENQTVNQENNEVEVKQEPQVEEKVENVESETVESKTETVNEVEEKNLTQEDGKTVELADNVVSESKTAENNSLPVDVKTYFEIVKEKLLALGKVTVGVLEKIGEFVENLFKTKN